ncbi:MAG: CDP-diacylglycerol--glycerol-3-phosphate 3-phosphatidyltransferase [Oscillospiraceae bacterium]
MNLPNKLTILRMVFIPFFVACMLIDEIPHHFLWAFVLFAVASFTDMLDGMIARKYNLITDFGKFMDPLADKLLVTSAMVCFVQLELTSAAVVILILCREFLVTSLRTLAAGKGVVIAADRWGKYKTVMQIIWICFDILFVAFAQTLGYDAYLAGTYIHLVLMCSVVILTLFSGFNYMWKNRSVFSED